MQENIPGKCSRLGRLSNDVSGSKAAILKVCSTLFFSLKIQALEYTWIRKRVTENILALKKCVNIVKTRKHADSAGI
jgi:hypothetical protein